MVMQSINYCGVLFLTISIKSEYHPKTKQQQQYSRQVEKRRPNRKSLRVCLKFECLVYIKQANYQHSTETQTGLSN